MSAAPTPLVRLGRVRLARVAKELDWFLRYLHQRERALAAAMPVAKRRIDFVAGRVAAKRALGCGDDVYVLPDTGERAGAPVAHTGGGERLATALSISHGAGWAVAAASAGGELGIDVERIEPRPPSFLDEAFAPGELARWAAALGLAPTDAIVVTTAWCAKEALLKRAGVGLRLPLHAVAPTRIVWRAAPLGSDGALAWADCETDRHGAAVLAVQLLPARQLALVLAV